MSRTLTSKKNGYMTVEVGGGGGGGGDGSPKTDQPSFYGPGKPYPTKEAAEAAAEEETRQADQKLGTIKIIKKMIRG